MNPKLLVLLVAIFIAINAALFFLAKGGDLKNLSSTTPKSSESTITLPIPLSHKGVSSTIVVYNFRGVVTDLASVPDGILMTLDFGEEGERMDAPDIIVDENTKIYKIEDEHETPSTTDQIKVGTLLTAGMVYNLYTKTWRLNAVYISQDSFTDSPTAP